MPRTCNAPVPVDAGALLCLRAGEAAQNMPGWCVGQNTPGWLRRAGAPGSGGGAGDFAGGGQRGGGAGAYNGQVYSWAASAGAVRGFCLRRWLPAVLLDTRFL